MSGDIVWFSDAGKFKEIIGKKGFAIAKLYQSKYPLAPGFIVSQNAYDNLMKNNDLNLAVNAILLNIEKESQVKQLEAYEKIQEVLQKSEFSNSFKEELKEAIEILPGKFQIIQADPNVSYSSLIVDNQNDLESALKRCFAASYKDPVNVGKQSALVLSVPEHELNAKLSSRTTGAECYLELSANGVTAEYEISKKPDLKLNKIKDNNNLIRLIPAQTLSRMIFYSRDLEKQFNCPQQVSFLLNEKGDLTIVNSEPHYVPRQEQKIKDLEISDIGLKQLSHIIPLNEYVFSQKLMDHHHSKIRDSVFDSLHFNSFITTEMQEVTEKIMLKPYLHHEDNAIGLDAVLGKLENNLEVKMEEKNEIKVESKIESTNNKDDYADYEKAILDALGD